jgi:hypothetical protein
VVSGAEIVDQVLAEKKGTNDAGFLIKQANTKFNSFIPGTLLLEKQGIGTAGWQPYIGSLLALIPRPMLPDKPVPGSLNGLYSGHPSKMVAGFMGMSRSAGSVGVSPVALAVWQLGFGGLLLLVCCNILNWYLINSLLLCPSLVHRALGLYLIGIPLLNTLFASPDVLLLNSQRVALTLILFQIGYWILRRSIESTPGDRFERLQGTASDAVPLRVS